MAQSSREGDIRKAEGQSYDKEFSRLAQSLDYPVYIVTTRVEGENTGCLIGFGSQCSVHPPRFMACLSKKNHTFDIAMRASHLAVHVVDEPNRNLAEIFGGETGDRVDKFTQAQWDEVDSLPVLRDCPRWFIGEVLERVDLGDHVGHLLQPTRVAPGPATEQLTYQQAKTIHAGHAP